MSHENFEQLWVLNEQGAARLATNEEIVRAARSVMSRRVRRGTSMASPKLVKDFLSTKLGALEHETFCVMLLDKRHRATLQRIHITRFSSTNYQVCVGNGKRTARSEIGIVLIQRVRIAGDEGRWN